MMNWKSSVFFVASLLVILVAARLRWEPSLGVEVPLEPASTPSLQLRVAAGEAAAVPPELAALMAQWPERNAPPAAPDEIELGRLLFFDPILSGNKAISCATCHHPDHGLSDGLAHSVGVSGVALPRSAPSLWNVVFREHFTWDGRATSLASQMLDGPIFHPDEMAADPDQLLADLQATPEYARRFGEVYGDAYPGKRG